MPSRLGLVLLLPFLLLPAVDAAAQNPFLTNRGKRTIASIEFEGNTRTKDYVLRRELGFAVGDEYDGERISEAWERLEALPFIAYVDIETERPGPGEAALVIQVEEDTRFRWAPGLEYSRRHGESFHGIVDLGLVNLTGRAESVDLQVTAWARRGARLMWQNPWILGEAKLGVYASSYYDAYDWEYDLDGAVDPDARFSDWGFRAGVWRAFDPWVTASAHAAWREIELEDLAVVQDPQLTLALDHDRRDARYYPTEGTVAHLDVTIGGLSDAVENYTTTTLSFSNFATLPVVDVIVAGHASYRAASAALPLHELTFLGGPLTLRGLDFGDDFGDQAWRATLELRRPLLLLPLREGESIGVGVHVFHDWGAAFAHDASLGDQETRFSFGAGAHFNFLSRNFRFEWARNDDWENHFVFEDTFTF